MTRMVEQAAAAIMASPAWSSFWSRDDARVFARAAIEAMREPTPEMLTAVGPMDGYCGDEDATDVDHVLWWHDMIDAALSEDGPT